MWHIAPAATIQLDDSTVLDWKVFEPDEIRVQVTPIGSATVSQYQFKTFLHSNSTGLYFDDHGGTCYPSLGRSEHVNWQSSLATSYYLIRCGLGGFENEGILVKAKLNGAPDSSAIDIPIARNLTQAPHWEDRVVSYKIDQSNFSGSPPAYLGLSNSSDERSYEQAQQSLATAAAPVFERRWEDVPDPNAEVFEAVSSGPDVTVKGYWHYGATTTDSTCGTPDAPNPLGCVYTYGPVPHHTLGDMWVKHPPAGYNSYVKEPTKWSNNVHKSTALFDETVHFYLPQFLMHEFGHTVGLSHTPNGIMGGYEDGNPVPAPNRNDAHGFLEVIRVHHLGYQPE